MDLVSAFDAPIVQKIAGRDVIFPIIPVSVLSLELASKAKSSKITKAKAMVEDFKLFGQEKLMILRDGAIFQIADFQDYIMTIEGATEAIKVSLGLRQATSEDVTWIFNHLKPFEVIDTAMLVTGFATLTNAPKEIDEVKENPLPQTPETPKGFGDK